MHGTSARFDFDMIPHRGLPILSSRRPWAAHKCQRQSSCRTMHHEASLHHKVWIRRRWHAEAHVHICVYVSCMYECVWTWALMQQREQREFTMYLSPPVHPIFSVRWSASCRRLNRGFLANVTYIKIFAFARRACKWAISAIYYNWYRPSRARRVNRDRNFSLEILFQRISVIYRRIPATTNRQLNQIHNRIGRSMRYLYGS